MKHNKFMQIAVEEAQKTGNDVPVGAIIVKDDQIIAKACNEKEKTNDVSAHAEILALKKAANILNNWRLEGCKLYVTLEPCQMCAGAIVQARIPEVIMAAENPKAGCAGSVMDILNNPDFNHQVVVKKGVLESECSKLLKDFFIELRARNKAEKEQKGNL